MYLIDVSHHQGIIDWDTVKKELIRVNNGKAGGAMLRAGYTKTEGGLTIDKQFQRNADACEELSIPYGIYVYSYDHGTIAAKRSMNDLIELLQSTCRLPEYPVYYDIEYETFNKKAGKDLNTAIVISAMTTLEASGYFAGVYASRDFFLNYLKLKDLLKYSLWEAAYTKSDTGSIANDMWQYSSTNALGISGFGNYLDCNVCYRDFPSIIKAAGLNGFSNHDESKAVDWNSKNNEFIITATGADRIALKNLCDSYHLPVKNYKE